MAANKTPTATEEEEDEAALCSDMQLPIAFAKKQVLDKLETANATAQSWRMKERMKTVSVALVLCLNVGVDPPDVVKTQPCARYECWIDPLSFTSQKALEMIGNALQKQYERWQPRARYKQSLDPTADEVKKLCTSLRRNAKEERVLFHYNGHGVPKPTTNGEIWVFNRSYTQYIPLSIYDLQSWMGSPSIYVYDCSGAGIVVESFRQFAEQHEREHEVLTQGRGQLSSLGPPPLFKHCIQLAACAANEVLPMNPMLPADLFTSCLTTPIKIALRWFIMQNSARLIPQVTLDMIDKIPGQLTDRRTILGELNWIFTAITDTIAWNTLPRELFQKLFRQDLLVASLFRNFLLAERIMRSYDCSPLSSPRLPSTHQHPMWQAWDLALDICLAQLPSILEREDQFQHSPFFEEQLTAFQVWLACAPSRRMPPEQLPIVLQVLLSQVHRLRALELLGRFLDLGPWAVSLALSVGIFPYVLKLLQSSARELRPLLVFIWAKIMAVDSSCQADLVRDNGHKYFLSVLQDPSMPGEHRTLAAFVLASIVGNFTPGQEAALQGNLVSVCLEQLGDANTLLRQWLALCLGRLWTNFPAARWCGVRDIAHEKLYTLLTDPVPEVRASAVWSLGTFINSVTERSEHANNIDHSIAMTLVNAVSVDGSPLVRMELAVALQWVVLIFESSFIAVAAHFQDEEERIENSYQLTVGPDSTFPRASSRDRRTPLSPLTPSLEVPLQPAELLLLSGSSSGSFTYSMRKVASASCIANLAYGTLPSLPSLSFGSIYLKLWQGLLNLERDPSKDVAEIAKAVADHVRAKVKESNKEDTKSITSVATFTLGESPPPSSRRSTPSQSKKLSQSAITEEPDETHSIRRPIVTTTFLQRSCQYFAQPVLKYMEETDTESPIYYEREWRFLRNAHLRRGAQMEQQKTVNGRIDEHLFSNRNHTVPCVVRFHPYEPHLLVADKDSFSVWAWDHGQRLSHHANHNPKGSRITALEYMNAHDIPLIMTGTDQGAVQVWRNPVPSAGTFVEVVAAWQAMPELANARGSGLVLAWEQSTQLLLAAGDMRVVRVWDLERQLRLLDIPTGADKCVTCLSSGNSLVVAGCGDGSIRVFDRRLQASESRIMTWREHPSWVVDAHLHMDGRRITSGCTSGDVRFFEMGQPTAASMCNTTDGMTAMSVHPYADIFACSSVGQFIGVYGSKGTQLNSVKYHDGFMGQRIGPARCLSFHPLRILLAAGSVDSFVSVYGLRR